MRLHFSIVCYDCRRAPGSRYSQILPAHHVHRRAGVHNKFSFLRIDFWMVKGGTTFP